MSAYWRIHSIEFGGPTQFYDEIGISTASAERQPTRLHPITTPHSTERRHQLSNEGRRCP